MKSLILYQNGTFLVCSKDHHYDTLEPYILKIHLKWINIYVREKPENQVVRGDEQPLEIVQCLAWDHKANQNLTSVCIHNDYSSWYEETEKNSVICYIYIFFTFPSLKNHWIIQINHNFWNICVSFITFHIWNL